MLPRSQSIRMALALAIVVAARPVAAGAAEDDPGPHRSPVALALSADGSRLLTANQSSRSVSLIDTSTAKVLHEVETGDRPSGIALAAEGRRGVVAHWFGSDLAVLEIGPDRLEIIGRVEVGPEPRGVAIGRDGRTAFVAVGAADEVVRVDLDRLEVDGRLAVGREPRGLALSPDGRRLAVGNARSQSLSIIDIEGWAIVATIPIEGDNLRQVAVDAKGQYAYVANMKNRAFPTNRNNIDLGWVLGQRLTRVPVDGSSAYATLSLDPQGRATADAHGVALSEDGRWIAVSCGGTHEVLIFQADGRRLPWRSGGARDLIAAELLRDDGRFRRVDLGGRPTELTFAPDGKTLYVANALADAVQVVDAEAAALSRTIPLGGPAELSKARRGEVLFHDATRSFNQWYSCNTCHSDGHTNGLDFDTLNDGWQDRDVRHLQSRKKVPSLRGVTRTGPWTWHGWQDGLEDAVVESFTKSMQGPRPSADEAAAVVAYLETLDYPPNPNRTPEGELSPAARRGEAVFRSARAACATCHSGPDLTDGKVHDVGLGERGDVYEGHNPPSLRGVYDKGPYLHDGRARTLRDALTGDHDPDVLVGQGPLSEAELDDLIAYLESL